MTVPVWPEDLPRPSRRDLRLSRQDPRKLRPAEVGPPSYRRRTSAVARPVQLSVTLYRWQLAVFDTFYVQTVSHGATPFWMPDPTTDGWPMLTSDGTPVLTHDGTPILLAKQWLCLFGDNPPEDAVDGLRFRVSFDVWVMP
ncbi:hypothetical protein [Salipiger mucosus]|uniref:Uncharacterized protein n=1 Tax=Salipiger mucosus DSM 16094 TaxID=1123237 RepID=S9S7D3_9RHOB|nr:hypothetical protein [Salipiger mucosus]EPX82104.1 hypothetical protein Salmuc_02472 [Salipiger mucosus DSM 16094]